MSSQEQIVSPQPTTKKQTKTTADIHFEKLVKLDEAESKRDQILDTIIGKQGDNKQHGPIVSNIENNISKIQPTTAKDNHSSTTLFDIITDSPTTNDKFILRPDPENHPIGLSGAAALIAGINRYDLELQQKQQKDLTSLKSPSLDSTSLEPSTIASAGSLITANSINQPISLYQHEDLRLFHLTPSTKENFDHGNYTYNPGISDDQTPPPPGKQWNSMYTQPLDPDEANYRYKLQEEGISGVSGNNSNKKIIVEDSTTSLGSFFSELFGADPGTSAVDRNRHNKKDQVGKLIQRYQRGIGSTTSSAPVGTRVTKSIILIPKFDFITTIPLNPTPKFQWIPPPVSVRLNNQIIVERNLRAKSGNSSSTASISGTKLTKLDQRMVTIRNDKVIGLLLIIFSHLDKWKLNQIEKEMAYRHWVELLFFTKQYFDQQLQQQQEQLQQQQEDEIKTTTTTTTTATTTTTTTTTTPKPTREIIRPDYDFLVSKRDEFLDDVLRFRLPFHLHHYPPTHSVASPSSLYNTSIKKTTQKSSVVRSSRDKQQPTKYSKLVTKQQVLEMYEPEDYIDCDSWRFFIQDFPLNDDDFAAVLTMWISDYEDGAGSAQQHEKE